MANAVPVHSNEADKKEDVKAPSTKVKAQTVKAPEPPKADNKAVTKPAPKLGDNQTLLPDGSIRTDS